MTGVDEETASTPDAPSQQPDNAKRSKLSRWDRPPEPHDWRWIVGHIGRAMITVGLLMFGFVAYQLWGTGIQTARAQNNLDHEFERFIEDAGITPDTLGPTTTIAVTDSTTPTAPPTTAPAPAPVVQDYGNVDPGDGIAQLTIPRIGVDYKVVAGVSVKDLRDGPGHFPNTPLPGQLGNSAIAGHRTTYGAPFYDLDELKPGDEIQFRTKLGGAYVYIVTDTQVVSPSDYFVITDSDPTKATVTLVTCTPIGSAKQRLVVHGTLDISRSSTVGAPVINYGQVEPIPVDTVLPGDEPVESAASTPSTETTPSSAGSATSTVTTTAPSSDASEFSTTDAFSQGWFDDGSAWPQVILWGVLLAAVWYGAYRVAKHFRRLWLGILVGFVPFIVVLYFFYENVNRLLPAAI